MYDKILIATDGSELSTQGVTHGLELAKALSVPVVITTTTESLPILDAVSQAEQGRVANPLEGYEKAAADLAQKILSSAEAAAKKLGVSNECVHVKDRHPADGIIETATSKGCNLIVMASHGRRGVKQVLLGSVAAEVLSKSKVPVMVVR